MDNRVKQQQLETAKNKLQQLQETLNQFLQISEPNNKQFSSW